MVQKDATASVVNYESAEATVAKGPTEAAVIEKLEFQVREVANGYTAQ